MGRIRAAQSHVCRSQSDAARCGFPSPADRTRRSEQGGFAAGVAAAQREVIAAPRLTTTGRVAVGATGPVRTRDMRRPGTPHGAFHSVGWCLARSRRRRVLAAHRKLWPLYFTNRRTSWTSHEFRARLDMDGGEFKKVAPRTEEVQDAWRVGKESERRCCIRNSGAK